MKVLKFGGTSVGSAARIKHVADLICRERRNVVVLSAMSGTTNSLVEIAEYLYKGNVPGAQEVLNTLERKYESVVDELMSTDDGRRKASSAIDRVFALLRSFLSETLSEAGEKEILAQGELMSTALMQCFLEERGMRSVLLPALDYMRTLENGEPDMQHISVRLKRMLDLEPEADLFITQGYICRNDHGGIDNLKRGGSDYTASIIGAVLDVDEIQIWTDIDGMHNNDPRFVDGTRPVE
ncbi:MAG: aspartate kinase, partial [Muribaculaceae bacterium]|nr:aspartate kinase [Muribaculaceae bacterium]